MSAATASAVLAAVFQAQSFSYGGVWAKLHIGDPGGGGTLNPAAETTLVDASTCFGSDPVVVDGTLQFSNDALIGPWEQVAADETYTHLSLWSDELMTTFIGSGEITAAAVNAGDDFSVPIGNFTAVLAIAAGDDIV
jgi:hypothetical protein